jgi:nucleotide-binding universal stress UspA family protein
VYAAERWERDLPFHAAPGMCESLTEMGGRALTEAAERAAKDRPRLPVTAEVIFDTPAHALCSFARRADVIVVGQRGSGGFVGMLLGSTGLRIAGHVPVPVIVVRGEVRERRGEVLAGVGLREDPDDVLGYAFDAAAKRGAWVRVVHAWDLPSSLPAISACEAAAMAQERLAGAVAPWRARFPGVDVVEQTPRGHPVGELTGRSSRAALLVIGSRDSGRRNGSGPGPVGHGVLHHADCPVAVVRGPE